MTADERPVARLEALARSGAWREESRLAAELPTLYARLADPRLRTRLRSLRRRLLRREAERYAAERARIKAGGLRGEELLEWLGRRPPEERELAVEQLLGIAHRPLPAMALPGDLVGYVASGVAAIVRASIDVPVGRDDLVVDVGAGLGKVTMLTELLTGARTRGVELQPALARYARARAARLGLRATCETGDAQEADLSAATVVFLYLPFTGGPLEAVLERIRVEATRRALVVCSLGLELGQRSWLAPRESDSFWLTVYDARAPGVPPAARRGPSGLPAVAERIAAER